MVDPLDSLLYTKIHIPAPYRSLIPRERLFARLNSGLGHRLILLSAPAGCGKTSLLCDWITNRRSDVNFAWVTLDETENDPSIYLQYIIAALQSVDADIGQSILLALDAPKPPPPSQFLTPLINQINYIDKKIVLVLDDYHRITDQSVHQITAQFIDRGDPGLNIVLATRADPPLPIYRYRAQGELTELRQAQLNFTQKETQDFLLQSVGSKLNPEEMDILHQRTEGWVVGLFLAGLSLQESANISESVAALSGNQTYIMEYLVNEVFTRQPEQIQDFLLKTSILNRLTGPLCDQLTGSTDGYITLEYLKAKNLFISALDNAQTWYRYHQLFADLLRRRLERAAGDQLPGLHQTASAWYAQNGQLNDAVNHAFASEDSGFVVAMLEGAVEALWQRGQHITVRKYLQRLQPDVLRSSVPLCLWCSLFAFFDRQFDQASNFLQIADELIRDNPSNRDHYHQEVLGMKTLQEAQLALYELDTHRAVELARRSLVNLPKERKFLRQIVQIILADSLNYGGNTDEGQQAYAELLASENIQNTYLFYSVAIRSITNNYSRGKLRQAYVLSKQLLEKLGSLKPKFPELFEAVFHITIGEILVEWNRLQDAKNHFDQAYTIFEVGSGKSAEALFLRMVRGYIAFGDQQRARQIVDLVEDAVRTERLPQPNLGSVLAWRAHIYLAEGNPAQAADTLVELGSVDCKKLIYQNEDAYLTMIRVWLSQGKFQKATAVLETLQARLEEGGRINRLIEAFILQAKTEALQKHLQTANDYLLRALILAEPEGFVRIFLDGGEVIRDRLEEMISDGYGSAYIHQIAESFGNTSQKKQYLANQTGLIESLSGRELQVLRFLRTHLSQQEIADEVCVSINTIRFHTKNIYNKLGVHNRSSAVEKATALGLL